MSKAEARAYLRELKKLFLDDDPMQQALDLAIEALRDEG